MVGLTTIALIERRSDISRSLFTRYWRDVHGVMAARIPGFLTYVQHHVTPLSNARRFEGIAIVSFVNEADRDNLATSEVSGHIHRDEQNVFKRALLYNLAPGAAQVIVGARPSGHERFLVLGDPADLTATVERLRTEANYLAIYDLTTGDPADWNQTQLADDPVPTGLVHGAWSSEEAACRAIGSEGSYRLDDRYVMVEDGMPTALGLRGLDAVRTIEEAGADNQLQPDVVRAIYKMGIKV